MAGQLHLYLLVLFCLAVQTKPRYVEKSELPVMNPRFRTHVRPKYLVMLGDRLKLRCDALGRPAPYIHWYRNNDLMPAVKNQQRIKFNRFSMTVLRVEPGDEGEYSCKVWNQIGQIWRNFNVTIIDLPQWKHRMLEHGRMMAMSRNDPAELKEFLDPEDLSFNRDADLKSNPRLDELPQNDGGHLADSDPAADWNGTHVRTTPAWFKQFERAPYWSRPESEFIRVVASPAGRQLKLSCRANGEPEPQLIWYKNGEEITPERERHLGYQIKKWSLILLDLVPSDQGVYTCKVVNKYGELSHNYTVRVVERVPHKPIVAPDFPKNLTVMVGENATFNCPVLSDLQPHVEWFKHKQVNGTWMDNDENLHGDQVFSDPVSYDEDGLPVIDPFTLLITNVSVEDSTWYSCVIGNSLGMVYKSAWLEVLPASNDTLTSGMSSQRGWLDAMAIVFVIVACIVSVLFTGAYLLLRRRHLKQQQERALLQPVGFHSTQKLVKIIRDSQYLSNGSLAPLISIVPVSHHRLSSDLTILSEYLMDPDPEWEIDREQLILEKVIGEGAFGQVWCAQLMPTNGAVSSLASGTVAVKMLKSSTSDREMTDLVSEMEVMKCIGRHINIINLIGCCTQNGPLYVVVEYCANGNLRDYLKSQRPNDESTDNYERPNSKRQSLIYRDLVMFAHQIARGMEHLSSRKCIHRDLAARNVLVTEDLIMKIADFGLARDVRNVDYYKKTSDGRLPVKWMAPEALFDHVYTVQSDVWSFGILVWEIMTLGGNPYPSVPVEKLFILLKQGHRMERPRDCSEEIYQLMLDCWLDHPDERPSFADVVSYLDKILLISCQDNYIEMHGSSLAADDYPTTHKQGDGEEEEEEETDSSEGSASDETALVADDVGAPQSSPPSPPPPQQPAVGYQRSYRGRPALLRLNGIPATQRLGASHVNEPPTGRTLRPIVEVFEMEMNSATKNGVSTFLMDSGHSSENSSSPRESCSSDRSSMSVNSVHSANSSGRGTDGSLTTGSKDIKKDDDLRHQMGCKRHSVPDLSELTLVCSSPPRSGCWQANHRYRQLGSSCDDVFAMAKNGGGGGGSDHLPRPASPKVVTANRGPKKAEQTWQKVDADDRRMLVTPAEKLVVADHRPAQTVVTIGGGGGPWSRRRRRRVVGRRMTCDEDDSSTSLDWTTDNTPPDDELIGNDPIYLELLVGSRESVV